MKNKILITLLLFLVISAFSESIYAEPPTDIAVQNVELKSLLDARIPKKGLWSYKFVLLNSSRFPELLSESKPLTSVIPGSTLKIFTAWIGFEKKLRSDQYLGSMLKHSNNAMAKSLLNSIGGPDALETEIEKMFSLSSSQSSFDFRDGSGWSPKNHVTVNAEVQLLSIIYQNKEYDTFKRLLAEPRGPGTLHNRLEAFSGQLYAKTGTMPTGKVVSLTGFLETKKGTLVFSIIGNNVSHSTRRKGRTVDDSISYSRKVIDDVVSIHAKYLE